MTYRRDACIVGIGTSNEFGFDLGKSPLALQAEAFRAALDDAGLDKLAIDGLSTAHGSPNGVDYDEFVIAAGLDVRWAEQLWSHGRWATVTLIHAALAVANGLADCIAVANTSTSSRGFGRYLHSLGMGHGHEGLRDVGGGHGEWDIHGVDTPGMATALVAEEYMRRYGATPDDLSEIAVAFRAHALMNPMAIMRDKPMTRDQYFAEPPMGGPFRRADFCLSNEGATCLIVTTAERARDLARRPVVIAGFEGLRSSRDDYLLFSRPGLATGISRERPLADFAPPRVYEAAGVSRSDVDGLYLYDSFTSNVWMVLERFGFCGEGDASDFIRENGFGEHAQLGINTNGGLLSEAHLLGYGHLIEMVRQLRGEAGARQLPGPEVLQWATPRGDSAILTK